ncbi:hypothetical protein SELR_14890 [Selenomonas ruminantium subsp. lactilytica TAM6421]|uniref:Uncharacterized protein n=1 Tax=Selenomonas ruminantium subsp. lactilytica (strain NBRC 103574 / TAM6421) TaxID=927704 RepID=I0GR10_SELRL|nr:hypothetical protein [Selenomonas ruminantium]BAL83197.1 hypothetical protein SELR_14890 [Selenomonas ruminantium subsp. lactilytica TAM6421]
MLVWIERLGRMGEEELFGFGLSPESITGEILLDPLGNTRICKENPAMSDSQMLVVKARLDEWIRDLGYCQLSCISAPHYVEQEEETPRKWRPRELDLRPLNLPMKGERFLAVPEEEWAVAI